MIFFKLFFATFACAALGGLRPARAPQRCWRCGHQVPTCSRCSRREPILGASIDGLRYCHTFTPYGVRSCYQLELHERAHRREGKDGWREPVRPGR